MDSARIRRFVDICKNIISGLTLPARKNQEQWFVEQLELVSVSAQSSELSATAVAQVKALLKQRERWARDHAFHYTRDATDRLNQEYIRFAYGLSRIQNVSSKALPLFITLLFDVKNPQCINLYPMNVADQKAFDFCVRYHLLGDSNEALQIAKEELLCDLQFSPYPARGRGRSYGSEPSPSAQVKVVRPELHGLYVYENTVYSVRGLLKLNGLIDDASAVEYSKRPYQPFSSRLPGNINRLRPLHVVELYQLTLSGADASGINRSFSTLFQGVRYASVYELLHANAIPLWHQHGPCKVLPCVQIISWYLTYEPSVFLEKLRTWCTQLLEPAAGKTRVDWINEVNALYGHVLDEFTDANQSVSKRVYFIDWLLAVMYLKPQQVDALIGNLAAWYCTRHVDHWQAIQGLFAAHERTIRDTPADYFNLAISGKTAYEKLAKYLSEALDSEYYQILIATLAHDTNRITGKPLTEHPLQDYILSEDHYALIDLTQSVAYFDKHNTFINVSEQPHRLFTAKETERIRRNPCYATYAQFVEKPEQISGPISQHTFNLVFTFVDKCLRVDDDELRALKRQSDDAYASFCRFFPAGQSEFTLFDAIETYQNYRYYAFRRALRGLLPNERKHLESHKVRKSPGSPYWISVGALLDACDAEPDKVCYTTLCKQLLPLILDYDNTIRFKPAIEGISDIRDQHGLKLLVETLRLESRKRTCCHYDGSSQDKIMRANDSSMFAVVDVNRPDSPQLPIRWK